VSTKQLARACSRHSASTVANLQAINPAVLKGLKQSFAELFDSR
jgi:hypothetical protein